MNTEDFRDRVEGLMAQQLAAVDGCTEPKYWHLETARKLCADLDDRGIGFVDVRTSIPLNLGAMANRLDAHAVELAESDEYEGARLVIETAEAFARRQQQLEAGDFR